MLFQKNAIRGQISARIYMPGAHGVVGAALAAPTFGV